MESTKNMIAKFGRSKSLMERAIGFQDPGATSVWIIVRSMREFAESGTCP
jgi:dihydroxyacetone kinase